MSHQRYALEDIRFGSVCSGIEAASVAWHHLGWRAAWLSEIDKSASAVLAERFPDVPNLGDMTTIAPLVEAGIVEAPGVLVGGTPCQGFSVAGRRGGLSDPRGQLTLSYVEILDAIDAARRAAGERECIAVWENVPGVLSMADNAFGNFLAALAGEDEALVPSGKRWSDAGLVVGPERAVAWRILDAQYFGLAQRRKRVIVVASARDGFDSGEILFEFDGLRRDSPPSRQKGQDATHDVAPCLVSSGRGVERTGDPRGQDPVVGVRLTNRVSQSPVGARMLGFGHYEIDGTASTIKARDFKDATDLIIDGPVVHSFDARQKDVVQYGNLAGPLDTNGYSQAIAFTAKDHGQDASEDISPTLRSGGHVDSHANGGVMPAVAYAIQERAVCENPDAGPNGIGVREDVAYTLEARQVPQAVAFKASHFTRGKDGAPSDVAFPLTADADKGDQDTLIAQEVIPFDTTQLTHPANRSSPKPGDPCHPLAAAGHPPAITGGGMAVRRLMPVECERLQGFPDGWTRIRSRFYRTQHISATRPADMWEVGFDPNGQPGWWLMVADGPRYKQLGNSMAVHKMAWVGGRIKRWLQLEPFRELIG